MNSCIKRNPFKVLAIETSCDDTSVAIVSSCRRILSHIKIDQFDHHKPFGGIVPRLAGQLHRQYLPDVLSRCIKESGLTDGLNGIDAVSATRGPGLSGSLSAGFEAGRLIASTAGIPFFPVHHMVISQSYIIT